MSAEDRPATYFASPQQWRDWLTEHAVDTDELWVGFYKAGSSEPTMTWAESVEEALRAGWIDGVRQRVDESRYRIRFTPRRTGSTWSNVNVAAVERLVAEGRMSPAGIAAYEARSVERTGTYSFEQADPVELAPAYAEGLAQQPDAAAYWESRPAGYRRAAAHWVMGAKREDTRERRFAQLLEACAAGRLLPQFTRR